MERANTITTAVTIAIPDVSNTRIPTVIILHLLTNLFSIGVK